MTNKLGVKYEDADYAGLVARVVIFLIDLTIVIVLFVGCMALDTFLMNRVEYYDDFYFTYLSVLISLLYLTIIKTTKIGTLGQIVTNTRVETIYGTKPGIVRMTARLLFWLVGPLNFAIDFLFLTMIKEKRAVRDCLCNTIVVRKNAIPTEKDVPIHVTRIFALGLNLMYESCNSKNS